MGGALIEGIRSARHGLDGKARAVVGGVDLYPSEMFVRPQNATLGPASQLYLPGSTRASGEGSVQMSLAKSGVAQIRRALHRGNFHREQTLIDHGTRAERGAHLPLIDRAGHDEVGVCGVAERHSSGAHVACCQMHRHAPGVKMMGEKCLQHSRPTVLGSDDQPLTYRVLPQLDEAPHGPPRQPVDGVATLHLIDGQLLGLTIEDVAPVAHPVGPGQQLLTACIRGNCVDCGGDDEIDTVMAQSTQGCPLLGDDRAVASARDLILLAGGQRRVILRITAGHGPTLASAIVTWVHLSRRVGPP